MQGEDILRVCGLDVELGEAEVEEQEDNIEMITSIVCELCRAYLETQSYY